VVRRELIDSGRVQTNADLKRLRIGLVAHDIAEFELDRALEASGLSPSDVTLFDGGRLPGESAVAVQEVLSSLVDKSLVQVEQRTGRSRYRLLETLRQYAADRLREARAERAARTRHLNWCVRLSRALEQEALGPRRETVLQRLEAALAQHAAWFGVTLLAIPSGAAKRSEFRSVESPPERSATVRRRYLLEEVHDHGLGVC